MDTPDRLKDFLLQVFLETDDEHPGMAEEFAALLQDPEVLNEALARLPADGAVEGYEAAAAIQKWMREEVLPLVRRGRIRPV